MRTAAAAAAKLGYDVSAEEIRSYILEAEASLKQKAQEAGCYECVLYRPGGRVTEGSHSNVHILKDGVLITHPADEHILPGISRKHIISMCGTLGIPVEERLYTLDELKAADEVLISSCCTFAIRVAHVDGDPVGGKDPETFTRLANALEQEFADYVEANRR